MKKRIAVILTIILLVVVCFGGIMFKLFRKKPNQPNQPSTPLKFQSIEISEMNTSTIKTVIGAKRTENGVLIYRGHESITDNKRVIIREVTGDARLLGEMKNRLGEYGVAEWAGFSGENPSGVLDGVSFVLECRLTDGSTISARGTNNYPNNYRAVYRYIEDMAYRSVIDKTVFSTDIFTVQLPESWVGEVRAVYEADCVVFELPIKNSILRLFRIDFREWELNNTDGVYDFGRIEKTDGEKGELFLALTSLKPYMTEKDGTEKQHEIFLTVDDAKDLIIDSMTLSEGYRFVDEDR